MSSGYDQADPKSIEKYGKRLLGKGLRDVPGVYPIPLDKLNKPIGVHNKAGLGSLLEKFYYGISPGNESEPDFKKAGVELKSTPIHILKSAEYSPKERLVLNVINYSEEAKREYLSSIFLHKNACLMLISYVSEKDVPVGDLRIMLARLIRLKELPKEDQLIIRQDWEKIISEIRKGKAGQLKEGGTMYLGACTKAAKGDQFRKDPFGRPVKPRAFAFKGKFMRIMLARELQRGDAEQYEKIVKDAKELNKKSFEEIVFERFRPYIGKTSEQIGSILGKDLQATAKGILPNLSRRILGVREKKIEEFEKADITMKTFVLERSGRLKESISFPSFEPMELVRETWDESELKATLEKRFFFVVFRKQAQGAPVLEKVLFWVMPKKDIEGEGRKMWRLTKECFREGRLKDLPGMRIGRIVHVRPHATKGGRKMETPKNGPIAQKSFWLTNRYIRKQLEDRPSFSDSTLLP